jgi:hypothetical protein
LTTFERLDEGVRCLRFPIDFVLVELRLAELDFEGVTEAKEARFVGVRGLGESDLVGVRSAE